MKKIIEDEDKKLFKVKLLTAAARIRAATVIPLPPGQLPYKFEESFGGIVAVCGLRPFREIIFAAVTLSNPDIACVQRKQIIKGAVDAHNMIC